MHNQLASPLDLLERLWLAAPQLPEDKGPGAMRCGLALRNQTRVSISHRESTVDVIHVVTHYKCVDTR